MARILSFVALLSFTLFPLPLASIGVTYHIKPTLESPCHHRSCLTLSEYANTVSNYSDPNTRLVLVFYSGEHTLNDSITFQMLNHLSLLGNVSSLPDVTSKIVCNETSAFAFTEISTVEIKGLNFEYCGIKGSTRDYRFILNSRTPDTLDVTINAVPSISALYIANFSLSSCCMVRNHLPLLLNKSSVYLQDVIFKGNKGRFGGAIAAHNSTIVFQGHNTFDGNDAAIGGGIFANGSELIIKGSASFVHNTALSSGGGVCATYSTINFHRTFGGFVMFKNNSIKYHFRKYYYQHGGAVALYLSVWTSTTVMMFMNNRAYIGGAVYMYSTTSVLVFNAPENDTITLSSTFARNYGLRDIGSSFSNNTALNGGAMFLDTCIVRFYGNTHFGNNKVTGDGAAIWLYGSILEFNNNTNFTQNEASQAGAMSIHNSTVEFNGDCTFDRNEAYGDRGGAIIATYNSNIKFNPDCEDSNTRTAQTEMRCGGCTTFTGNLARTRGGGIDISFSMLTLSGKIKFTGNRAQDSGGAMYVWRSVLHISGVGNYSNNRAYISGGAVRAKEDIVVFSGDQTMLGNFATFGGAIWMENSSINFTGVTAFDSNVATYGGAIYADGSSMLLNGTNIFTKNVAKPNGYGGYGGGIHMIRSNIVLSGLQNFTNNSANYGGALTISNYDPNHCLSFVSTAAHFIDNYAEMRGGAMFIEDAPFFYCASDADKSTPGRVCFFKWRSMEFDDVETQTFQEIQDVRPMIGYILCMGNITFERNHANEGGNAIYGGALEKCRVELTPVLPLCTPDIYTQNYHKYYASGLEVISRLAETTVENFTQDHLNIASDAFSVILCGTLEPHCNQSSASCSVHPGKTLILPVLAVGQAKGAVPAVVHATLSDSESQKFWLGDLQHTQPVNLSCTSLGYTLLSRGVGSATLILSAEGPCGDAGIPLYIRIGFLPCPTGFSLSQSSGSCECDNRLRRFTNSCDIDDRTITRDGEFWIGYDSQLQGLILHPHCSFDYCKDSTISFTIDSTDVQCAHKRSGILCGACKYGLSHNLGSSRCSSCSNWFLLLFLLFAIAGFVLVLVLFIFKITVAAGTSSGLIFYANVIAVNRRVLFPSRETNILTVFISWLNLDLGFQTCLFSGMDAYSRTWLQFMFPLYIWLLVGLVTLVSYYSTTIARIIGPTNPIAVLATLFLLSYTKLLRTIITTFSFTSVEYPNRSKAVWAYDGNVGFLEGRHIALFLVGLLAFLFLFLPYTLLLLFGQWIERGSNHKLLSWVNNPKVKSFLDAYHAPYANQHRYWTGLLMLLRCILFITSAVIDINSPKDPSVNLLILAITCAGLMVWAWNVPTIYKTWHKNILESSFILNLAILAAASYQVKVQGGNQEVIIYTSVSITFATFLGVVVYHIITRTQETRWWRNGIWPKLEQLWRNLFHYNQLHQNAIDMTSIPQPVASPQPVPTTFIDLRESLLESQH